MGYQSRALRELLKCEVTGIEIDALAAEHARPYCDQLIVGDIEALDLDQVIGLQRFDVITFADVLEHLRDPITALSKVRPLIADGGYVLASVPNIAHCAVIYEMAHGRFEYRSLGLLDDTHIRFFTRHSVYQTFEQAGYLVAGISEKRLTAADTEFEIQPVTDEDRLFLEYVKQRNPDAETYQFIVKAIPTDDATTRQSELIAAQRRIELLLSNAHKQEVKIRQLESNLAWITNRPIYKFLSGLRRGMQRNKGPSAER
jgi:SAM-dependent methyltransferase